MRITESKLRRIIRNVVSEVSDHSEYAGQQRQEFRNPTLNSSNEAYNKLASCIEQGLLDVGVIGYPLKDLSYDQEQHVSSAIEDAISILMSLDGKL